MCGQEIYGQEIFR